MENCPGNDKAQASPLRVGILGAARIARKNIWAIFNSDSDCTLVAIASRSEGKAQKLAKDTISAKYDVDQNISFFEGDTAYDDLISSEGLVDALYIPLPTSVCKDWVIKALQSGKHVLVEKPVSLTLADYDSMLQVAYATNKYLQDGTMFVHHPRMNLILNEDVGKVNRVDVSFTFLGDDDFLKNDIRTGKNGDPLGCIGDLGWYCVRFGLLVFSSSTNNKLARSVQVTNVKRNDAGVPIDATCLVSFSSHDDADNTALLSFHCSFCYPLNQRYQILGSKQLLTVNDLVLPKEGTNVYQCHNQYLTEFDLYTVHNRKEVPAENCSAVQEVLMWKYFSKVASSLDDSLLAASSEKNVPNTEWNCGCPNIQSDCHKLSNSSYQTQKIINSLMESMEKNCAIVQLE